MQQMAFKHFRPELTKLAMMNVSSIDTRASLKQHFSLLSDERLQDLCNMLHLVDCDKVNLDLCYLYLTFVVIIL